MCHSAVHSSFEWLKTPELRAIRGSPRLVASASTAVISAILSPGGAPVRRCPNRSGPDIYTDKVTGTKAERPGLALALSHLRTGDTLIVWRLDRLARSLSNLIELVNRLAGQGIAFKSLTERIDTASATGKLVFHIFGALAEFERNLITERKPGRSRSTYLIKV
jgi:hypothetical protein